ncbi:macrolide family glycosyltransferase [Enterococcus hermanniensis]|uniref:MGT family glycosyltransferase n=1 Tax=Enterococcus hermanniensis TaxID=249189 RepID=A0A1L8TMK0_9ENTE|nr:macrolide family glycosyltransferase [Enterococcus hermanniensis]OJG45453.1 MGT family glycosyltransferase [Enterococcus hermanniensis]
MTKVLFLNVTTHGHVNPSLGLVNELTHRGIEVVYFSSEEFREKIENAGAEYRPYHYDLNIFKNGFNVLIDHGSDIIQDIFDQIENDTFDYVIHSIAMPFSKQIADYLMLPAISMLAVFMGMKEFMQPNQTKIAGKFNALNEAYLQEAQKIEQQFNLTMPDHFFDLIMNEENLNIVFTSEYFLPVEERDFFDEKYALVGADIYNRLEDLADFPIEQIKSADNVLYISFGTIFGDFAKEIYQKVFEAFSHSDYLVVMAAHKVGLDDLVIPDNFIIRDYVPQNEVLKYTDVAITHNGLNSMNDLILNEIPFVSLPMGSDQPALAKRLTELNAGICLDYQTVESNELQSAVEAVQVDPKYLMNLKKIKKSFEVAGGYKQAVDTIERYLAK